MERLLNKVAIVTGAASGQGAEEARFFASEGAKVIATDVQFSLLESVVKEINKSGGEALAIEHNAALKEDWDYVIKTTVDRFGKVDILINNAGIFGKRNDLEIAGWQKVWEVNVLGNSLGINAVVPEMKKIGGGSIINICSLSALTGISGNSPYTASKGATRALSKGAAYDFAKYNIRVNSIYPGIIRTPLMEGRFDLSDKNVVEETLARIPLGRIGDPIEIAKAALFLASDDSSYITGAELVVDGGQTTRA